MFGIGLGEILVIILIIFLISPKDIPKVMRKIAHFFNELAKLKQELMQMKGDVEDIVKDAKIDDEMFPDNAKKRKKNQIIKAKKRK